MTITPRFPAYVALQDTQVVETTTGDLVWRLWAIRSGQDFGLSLKFEDDNAVAVNLTGTTWKFVLRRASSDGQVLYTGVSGDGAGINGSTIEVVVPGTGGYLWITVPALKTTGFPVGSWYWTLMNTTGGQLSGWAEGPADVKLGAGR